MSPLRDPVDDLLPAGLKDAPEPGAGYPPGGVYEAVFESSRDGIVITEATLERPGPRIVAVNPAFCRMTGYRRSEILGRTPRALQGERTDPEVIRRIRPTLEAGEVFEGETFNYRKSGEEFLMRWYIAPVRGEDGEISHYMAVQRDVTEHRRLERLAQTSNAMEQLGGVFAGVRHELGNPVNNLKTLLRLLKDHGQQLAPESAAEYLDDALGEVERMEYQLEILRSFSFRDRVTAAPLDLHEFLDAFVRLLKPSHADVSFELEMRHLGDVRADARALHQVLINLTTNALEAMEDQPDRALTLRTRDDSSGVVLEVEDRGVGLTPAQQADLFKPFHSNKEGGTGLGLVLSRRLLTAMGGQIELQSREGRGATALVRLPLAFPRPPEPTLGPDSEETS
ncbi:MAG: ATP-binding protein [Acidobacteriota bacterium]